MMRQKGRWLATAALGLGLPLVACEKNSTGESTSAMDTPTPNADGVEAHPTAAANQLAVPTTAEPGATAQPANAAVDVNAMVPTAGDQAIAASNPISPPAGWKGQGPLAQRKPPLPKGSPRWASVEAQVIVRKGQKYLVATGLAEGIANQSLARTTAENRARSVLTQWVKDEKLEGSQVAEVQYNKRQKLSAARVEMPVPADWVPGQPIATAAPAAAPAPK